jgi:predicted aldo/keto reductase-like oxidoreductase
MQFKIKEWRRYYNESQAISKKLRDFIKLYKKGYKLTPQYDALIAEHKCIANQVSLYLTKCGMDMPKPLWVYDDKDATTHASSSKFAYGHLLKATN